MWKSTDAGNSWTCLTDHLPQIGVSGIDIDANNSNIIYITTGDDDAGDSYFVGVMKSTDGGNTWEKAGQLSDYTNSANEIYIDPTNSNIVWVATSSGLYKSNNSGNEWTSMLDGNIKDFKLKPGDSNTIYAVTKNAFYKSSDGGNNFTQITNGIPSGSGRMTIDITPAKPNYVYVLSAKTDNSFQGVYKSTNSGDSFSKAVESKDIFDGSTQASYDLALCVSDKNPEEIFVGVLNIWKSTNGGDTFYKVNNWNDDSAPAYTHADIHFLRYYDGILFAGTDGGIYRSKDNAGSFKKLTSGMAISQFYKISVSKKSSKNIIGGLQDNGGYVYDNDQWYNYHGADGMDAATDPRYKRVGYSFIQNGKELYKYNDGTPMYYTAKPAGETGRWVTPLVADENGVLYAGYKDLYKNENGEWTKLTNLSLFNGIECIEIDPSNPSVIYLSAGTSLYKTTNGGGDLQKLNTSFSGYSISSIEVNNDSSDIVYITTTGSLGQVYRSIDGGNNWTNISMNLPISSKNVVRHQQFHPNNGIYVGTYLGVWHYNDALEEWQPFSTGLPNVEITDLEITTLEGKLTASTYGRGIWQSDIEIFLPNKDISVVDASGFFNTFCNNEVTPVITIKNSGEESISQFTINYKFDDQNYSETWQGSLESKQAIDINLNNYSLDMGEHSFNIEAITDGDQIGYNNSSQVFFTINEASSTPGQTNSFEDANKDAWLVITKREEPKNLWVLDAPNGTLLNQANSGSKAYVTNPNGNYTNETLSLLYTPCFDLSELANPIMKFHMAFDIETDWDVLYVEYTIDDGKTWHVLGTADDPNWYNSNANENALTIGKQWSGKDTALKEYSHTLNDLTNETNVIFRFHFESDQAENGEGVVIDDFYISGEQLGIDDFNIQTMQLFPNPSKEIVTITFKSAISGSIDIYDTNGRFIKGTSIEDESEKSINVQNLAEGFYLVKIRNDDGATFVKKLIIR